MPKCSKCGEIVSAIEIKDGVCFDCLGIESNTQQTIQESNEEKESKADKIGIITLIIMVFLFVGGGMYFYKHQQHQKWISTVKTLASKYKIGLLGINYSPDEIEIIDSYKKEGKYIQILKIGKHICEMPMVKTSDGWVALGLKCKG